MNIVNGNGYRAFPQEVKKVNLPSMVEVKQISCYATIQHANDAMFSQWDHFTVGLWCNSLHEHSCVYPLWHNSLRYLCLSSMTHCIVTHLFYLHFIWTHFWSVLKELCTCVWMCTLCLTPFTKCAASPSFNHMKKVFFLCFWDWGLQKDHIRDWSLIFSAKIRKKYIVHFWINPFLFQKRGYSTLNRSHKVTHKNWYFLKN